jgi:hypothetical protein
MGGGEHNAVAGVVVVVVVVVVVAVGVPSAKCET